jgi:hypothetical protein
MRLLALIFSSSSSKSGNGGPLALGFGCWGFGCWGFGCWGFGGEKVLGGPAGGAPCGKGRSPFGGIDQEGTFPGPCAFGSGRGALLGPALNLGAGSDSSSSSSPLPWPNFGGRPWRGGGKEPFGVGATFFGGGAGPAGLGATFFGGAGPAGFGANFGEDLGMVAAQAGTSSSSSSPEPPRPLKEPNCGVRATRASATETSRAVDAGKADTESARAAARMKERILVWLKWQGVTEEKNRIQGSSRIISTSTGWARHKRSK